MFLIVSLTYCLPHSRFINFPATGDQLQSLFDACSAGKIEPGSFGMSFSPYDEGLVGVLEELLPREHIKTKNIKVELSKLSVYGKVYSQGATLAPL